MCVQGLDLALGALARVVAEVGPDQWSAPTVCDPWTVEDVLSHVLGVTEKFTRFALGDDAPRGRPPSGSTLDEIRAASRRAWAGCDCTRQCRLPFGTFNATDAAAINTLDVLVHAWDIAAAVGIDFVMPAQLVPRSIEIAGLLVTPESVRDGQFGDGGEVSGLTGQELLLAMTGRGCV